MGYVKLLGKNSLKNLFSNFPNYTFVVDPKLLCKTPANQLSPFLVLHELPPLPSAWNLWGTQTPTFIERRHFLWQKQNWDCFFAANSRCNSISRLVNSLPPYLQSLGMCRLVPGQSLKLLISQHGLPRIPEYNSSIKLTSFDTDCIISFPYMFFESNMSVTHLEFPPWQKPRTSDSFPKHTPAKSSCHEKNRTSLANLLHDIWTVTGRYKEN